VLVIYAFRSSNGGTNVRVAILSTFALFVLLPIAKGADSAEAELRAAMAERLQASLQGDSTKAASLMADDYIQTDISGHVQDKATWFREYFDPVGELIRTGKFRWEVYEQKELQFSRIWRFRGRHGST
jgi:hypothetical protein